MDLRRDLKSLLLTAAVFAGLYHLPVGHPRFDGAVHEALALTRWYAREHVLLCLVPAFFIAGGIGTFVSQGAVMRYLGAGARRVTAYTVAAVSGTVLAVCSCTVLPLFAGIYAMGAGLGPATAFLYAGPAVNALAIILTARVLGVEIGVARAAGAVVFSVVIGLLMHAIFRCEEARQERVQAAAMPGADEARPLRQTVLALGALLAVLVFANWGFARQILPLLLLGVLGAGLLLGRPGHEGLIPSGWIAAAVGGDSLAANLFAGVAGAFMYFATLTEVPILEGLIGSGMGRGPALTLLLAGPAVSLPSILVLRTVMGGRRTAVFIGLVVVLSAATGFLFGMVF